MNRNFETAIPRGYRVVDGQVVVNEVEAEYVKWLYGAYEEYHKNPPACLVEDIMRGRFEECGESLSYEEAKSKVPGSAIERYLDVESRRKWQLYQAAGESVTREQMKEILALPHEEVERQVRQLPRNASDSQKWVGISGHVADERAGVKAQCEPIISAEHFKRVQEILKKQAFIK